jgi:hypothetical protein
MTSQHRMNIAPAGEWLFFHDLGGRWRWEHRRGGSTVAESEQGYATREACIADARRHGFVPTPSAFSRVEVPDRTPTLTDSSDC